MPGNPIQEFLSQFRIPFVGDNLLRKYENEKSPLRAELLSTTQLESYAETLAHNHVVGGELKSEQLIKRLEENESVLVEVRQLLIESAQENSPVSPAGEWLLDNFYLIEDQIQLGRKHFPKGYSDSLPKLAKGPLAGYPRVYHLAHELIAHCDGRVDLEILAAFVNAYQKITALNLGELWAVPIMLRLALIENLRRLAAQIAIDRINKNLADTWADRMISIAEKDPKSLIIATADMARSNPPMASSFVAELTRRLLGKGPALTLPLTWIEQRLAENGLTTNSLVQQESQKQAIAQVSMSNSISSIRFLIGTDWRDFVENHSHVEHILRQDPHDVYSRMDFQTRDQYRHVIESLALRSKKPETEVTQRALALAQQNAMSEAPDNRKSHVGYYLLDKGLRETEKNLEIKLSKVEKLNRGICSFPLFWYTIGILVITAALTGLLVLRAHAEGLSGPWLLTIGVISFVTTSQLAFNLVNWISTILVKPVILPRMDYSGVIPEESKTLVVVPTLIGSTVEIDELVETMEVRYLANRQDQLYYALLTDLRDADEPVKEEEVQVLEFARQKIEALNKKYSHEAHDIFFLFHRPRKWNEVEQTYMGFERKRGKLEDLMAVLRNGAPGEKFELIVGDLTYLDHVKYLLTLDTDTQLPREAAWKIIGTMAHPLNQASYDEGKKRVTQGYGILQPRLATSISQSSTTWYAKIHASEEGIDPYTKTVSDVYQDLLGEGSFIGKGIVDIDAFLKALGNRLPENRILSHDLLEGCHARSGLINDVQLYEDYPSSYLDDMKRRHRWIRGDWQIARWLLPIVPGPGKSVQKNPLSSLSRWKIADNLRRSLVPVAHLLFFLFGWYISPAPWLWTSIGVGVLIPTSVFSFVYHFMKKPKELDYATHAIHTVENFLTQLLQILWTIISLPYEAFVNLDAILRTSWRIWISKKRLLQWEPFSMTSSVKTFLAHVKRMWIAPAIGIIILSTLSIFSIQACIIATPILVAWIGSPLLAWAISIKQVAKTADLSLSQMAFLRKISRKTWAYFDHFITEEDHFLPPDNFQEYPTPRTAHRTSPTNIGLLLLSNLAGHDFGYTSLTNFLEKSRRTLSTINRLDRYKGHLYNWYDTLTLMPLYPRYVSTVDSGNLAASLLILKEGLLALRTSPIVSLQVLVGIQDTLTLLSDKRGVPDHFRKHLFETEALYAQHPVSMLEIKSILSRIQKTTSEYISTAHAQANPETAWWANSLVQQCQQSIDDIEILLPFLAMDFIPDSFQDVISDIPLTPTLVQLSQITERLEDALDLHDNQVLSPADQLWLKQMKEKLHKAKITATEMLRLIDDIVDQCLDLSSYEYDFLFDKTQHYLSIGYNVEDHRRDAGYYDLLGSEARLGVFVAISQGKIPQESWFALGRQVTNSGKDPALISWSGSMFEYLMPMLLMPSYENTLLDQTHKGAVRRHIEYGQKRDLPWGISESCFNAFHANMDYQYRAFGVPGLGLKRGLVNDYVVAPYASLMALMVEPQESITNLQHLSSLGAEGNWGFYEAVDFTASRLPRGNHVAVVKSFMTHHQGMAFLALSYLLNGPRMQKRFQSDLHFQTSLLLLQEKIPLTSSFYTPAMDMSEIPTEAVHPEMQIIHTANTPIPEVQLLSNGRYHVMISNAGGGYSRWKDLDVTRWREDGTCDAHGNFCYIREVETDQVWSTSYQPTRTDGDKYEVIFSQGRAEFRRRDQQFESHTEIVVSPEDDVELRRLHLTNRSRRKRTVEVTSYGEVVLNKGIAEVLHPAFSNLFVQTKLLPDQHAILCTRRPRSVDEHPPYMFHLAKVNQGEIINISFETSREHFIGRTKSVHEPQAIYNKTGLKGHAGSVLDPIVAIQYTIQLKPYETVTIDMIYGVGETQATCMDLIDKYQDKHMADRAFELAWTHSQVVLRQINATATDALLYSQLAGSIIYSNSSLRADAATIIKNQRGQSGLWSHSISGDLPIVLLQIEDHANIALAHQLIQAHEYWRLKGLIVDLVIWNEDHGGYRQNLQNQIMSLISPIHGNADPVRPGGIFVRSSEQLSPEDRILFQTVARVIISDKLGTLEGQLSRRKWLKPTLPAFTPTSDAVLSDSKFTIPKDLQFFNGIGGYSKSGKEYVIVTSPGQVTPLPWSNVIANPNFGTVISESGQAYTWFQNAHELRITPWHNDPLTDSSGEHFYIRDEQTGRFWSPTPLPATGKTPYVTRHGIGYSKFEHTEEGIASEMNVYVDIEKPIKYFYFKIKNETNSTRQVSLTGFVEWILGDLKQKTMMHVITELDLNSGAIIAHNSYHTEFGRMVAFFDSNEQTKTITCDRAEFIGRNGTVANPVAMSKAKLSGKTGAALDACGAIQVQLTLAEGETHEVLFRMGTAMHMNDIAYLIREGRGRANAREAFNKVEQQWNSYTSNVKIETPSPAINVLANGWLNYQTLSCRIWGRSGYYQSGGAFGFRDQLQDVLSLLHVQPHLAKAQIILSASRQFTKGDVQHWWHPPVGRGVRTKCSDDYLWLPYVTSKYILATGDESILNEQVHFLESRELNHEEHSVYDLPNRSDKSASLYEHCIQALEYGCQFGSHGLPLIGSGDWNDGMDRVGIEGRGESVWLGWFFYDTIQKFRSVMQLKADEERIKKYDLIADTLRQNLNEKAWDGEWFRRAYFDDGTPLGSRQNDECRIDAIAQSWAILSGGGDRAKSEQGLQNAGRYLVKKETKIIQLLDPPFDKSKMDPGYIKGYVPGVRENGGQYTHAAIWMIMAYAHMGERRMMWELLDMILPVHHGMTKEQVDKYKAEPYVVAADVYAIAEHAGRGGWTWYTGSAGWMYQLILEYVCGLKRNGHDLSIEPCLPPHWNDVTIHYKYLAADYTIRIRQSTGNIASKQILLDGIKLEDGIVHLEDDGRAHEVEIDIVYPEEDNEAGVLHEMPTSQQESIKK